MTATVAEIDPPFELAEPAQPSAPLLLNSPHSGRVYPPDFLASGRLSLDTLRRSEDSFVDELFQPPQDLSLTFMRAHFPRSFIDLNREPYELDPRMFDGRLPPFVNTRSLRVAGGLGTIARVVGDAVEIYDRRLPVEGALQRIEAYYMPYHRVLRQALARLYREFQTTVLLDCHSMPSSVVSREDRPKADVVIGDRYGTSCAPLIVETVEATLRELGYVVHRNKPYAGGVITEHYGNPAAGHHALQIEINRALYLDEAKFRKSVRFERMRDDLVVLIRRLAELPFADLVPFQAAAE
ncbi:N-formylglutamate amidohydrolase [Blastochloris viridis]|uniref:N-formylglutamate deformylase n=1 Tax=Blastochloris viridis TaxID=1079 RepID=A0A182D2V0_BLAVI|nr:N-formylglutamate amidohydrolase [Blastochloris viridis]BAR99745.1 N-formylglutamate deformylase [Blastochloris viridis]